jgi:hypothetical protein
VYSALHPANKLPADFVDAIVYRVGITFESQALQPAIPNDAEADAEADAESDPLGGSDWLTLGGVDSLGVSPQWQHPSNIRRSLTMLSRLDNQPRIVAIRRRSFPPWRMCLSQLRFA